MGDEKVYTSMYSRNAELYHHGIKGQKWGIRNGPPYPLGSDISTGSRLKDKMHENVNKYYDEKKQNKEAQLRRLEKKEKKNEDKQAKLSKEQEKLAIKKEKVKNLIEKYSKKPYSDLVGELSESDTNLIADGFVLAILASIFVLPPIISAINVIPSFGLNI